MWRFVVVCNYCIGLIVTSCRGRECQPGQELSLNQVTVSVTASASVTQSRPVTVTVPSQTKGCTVYQRYYYYLVLVSNKTLIHYGKNRRADVRFYVPTAYETFDIFDRKYVIDVRKYLCIDRLYGLQSLLHPINIILHTICGVLSISGALLYIAHC